MTAWRLGFVCACALLGALCIMSGFFGLDMDMLEINLTTAAPSSSSSDSNDDRGPSLPKGAFDRLVFVVIDALRADMVLGNAAINHHGEDLSLFMPYTAHLATSDLTVAYVAQAGVPTVTMPRLKALTTGKQPAFIDVLRNFNSKALDDDNIMRTLHQAGYRMVLYGDETWLDLFPHLFHRHDATSGFFTTDTIFVDSNVTRHLHEELDPTMAHSNSRDWDVLVLHYLGVDHVGHMDGPHSSSMRHKLGEMDAVVRSIHNAIRAQDIVRQTSNNQQQPDGVLPTLFVLCSDHGMTNTGNHGGASIEESSALLLFVMPPTNATDHDEARTFTKSSRKESFRRALQVDLVPTLAALFGVAIPTTNTGKMLHHVLHAAGLASPLEAMQRNLRQLIASWTPAERAKVGATAHEKEVQAALTWAQEVVLQSDGSEYNTFAITLGVACTAAGMAVSFGASGVASAWSRRSNKVSYVHVVLGVGAVLQVASYGSSSAIENEHATWNFILTTLWMYLGFQHVAAKEFRQVPLVGMLAVTTRILRSRNQVINFGRLNDLPSLADAKNTTVGLEYEQDDSLSVLTTRSLLDDLNLPLGYETTWVVVCIGIYGIWKLEHAVAATAVIRRRLIELVFLTGLVAVSAYSFHPAVGMYAHATYACATVLFVSGWCLSKDGGKSCSRFVPLELSAWLLGLLLQREVNLTVLAVLNLQQACFFSWIRRRREDDTSTVAAVATLWMSKCAFYALGNSHLMTTIEIGKAYTGLTTYSQGIVGFFTFFIVMTGPTVVILAAFTIIPAGKALPTLWSLELLSFLVYSVIVYAMRFHLFIWSVFAPKMMYHMACLVWDVVLTVVAVALSAGSL
ncbi:hypothetical protein H257_14185 [Aphanomyces astaci]|uniref:GPI ethanolamine phosphate transferase 2 C-terminal domain-containing protein n=1 Tax=Aphanomyces astaci TaxID=112090 RepID=W4FTX7_APHAT|nr:hypothetical protein H257_14185 [Aphanomyces astaci]ETV70279.1 hypothetical protein H257_14185 [Aphanomyces astaci]|eukprot:XP_009840238.1 hypothetical protein H257_14185 [Aphanomyces astaci]